MKLITVENNSNMRISAFAQLIDRNTSTVTDWFNALEKKLNRSPTIEEMHNAAKTSSIATCQGNMTANEVIRWIADKYGKDKQPTKSCIYNRRAKYGDESPMVLYPKEGSKAFAERAVKDGLFKNTTEFFNKAPKESPVTSTNIQDVIDKIAKESISNFEKTILKNDKINKHNSFNRQSVLDQEYKKALLTKRTRSVFY